MRRALIACLSLSLLGPVTAAAQDAGVVRCDEPTRRAPQEVVPAVGANAVSIDAPLRVRYSENYFEPGVGPGGDPTALITVQRCPSVGGFCDMSTCGGEDDVFVPGLVQVLNDELVFLPNGGWLTSTAYTGIARGVDGDLPFHFCSGSSSDTAAPVLGSIQSVTSDPVEPRCDAPEGGFRVAVFFEPATDTGPPGSVEYMLFQTRGTDIEGAVLRDRVRNFPTDQITMAFVLPPGEAISPICVRVAAVDGLGNVDLSDATTDAETCVDPVQGNFFYGLCAASPGARPAPSPLLWLMAGVAVLVRRRRR